jgi:phage protein U
MTRQSFISNDGPPSAILSDGVTTIPLYAVNQITLAESYHLPTIGSSTARAAVGTHDDSVSLSGVLIGDERFALKFALETLAETSKRGSALEAVSGGAVSGLVLITGLTVRTDMQVQSLSFTASAGRRDVIDVSMTLQYMPRPGIVAKLLDVANLGVQALRDLGGRT